MPMLWRLQMQTRRKVGIGLIFAMGFIWVDYCDDEPHSEDLLMRAQRLRLHFDKGFRLSLLR